MALDRARLFLALDALKAARELVDNKDAQGLAALQRIARALRDHAANNGATDLAELAEEVQVSNTDRLEQNVELLLNELRRELFQPVRLEGGILVIAGDAQERAFTVRAITSLADRLLESESPGNAWSVLQREAVAAILLDISNDAEEGRILLGRIQSDPTLAAVPIIVLSSSDTPQLHAECLALGAFEYFTKPQRDERLLASIATLMGHDDRMMLELGSDPRSGLPTTQALKKAARRLQHEAEVSRRTYSVVLARVSGMETLHATHGEAACTRIYRAVCDGVVQSLSHVPRTEGTSSSPTAFAWQNDIIAILLPACGAARATKLLKATIDQISKLEIPIGHGVTLEPLLSVGGVEVLGMSFDRSVMSAHRMLELAEQSGATAPVITPLASAAPPRHRVLVVEDDHTVGEIVVRTLERAGLDAVLREDGLSALEIARDLRFDLVITDIVMPFMDGLRLVENLREIPRYKRTPILFLTSLTSERHVIQGFETGADAYITKPFNPRILAARVKSLLARNAG